MNLLDSQYESGIEHSFLTSRSIFKILSLVSELKKQFLWEENDIVLLFVSRGTVLASFGNLEKLSSVKNETPFCS